MADNPAEVAKVEPQNAGQQASPNVAQQTRTLANSGASWGNIPVMTGGMTFREVGSGGLRQFSGWVREDFLVNLQGRQAARTYREMRDNSATIGGILFAITATMRKVAWRVVPPDGQENAPDMQSKIDFVESLKNDMSETWEDFIVETLSMLPFGYSPNEIVYKRRLGQDPGPDPDRPGEDLPKNKYHDGLIGWRRLPLRGQDTIIKWFFDENGIPKGVTQQPWTGPIIDLPMEKLLLFRPSYTKNNPEGMSILRTAYRSYYFAKRLEEQEAILVERMSGFPVVRVPQQLIEAAAAGDPIAIATMNGWKKIVTNVRIDEQMGVVMPSNVYEGMNGPSQVKQYDLEFITPQGGRAAPDTRKMIEGYNLNMMVSVMADFLQLGHSTRGTQNLSNSKQDMFFQAVEGYLNSNAAVINKHGLSRVFRLNGMPTDNMPVIKPDLATRVDLDVLSNVVLRYSQAGMPMFPNEELQSYLMDAGGMPDVVDPEAMQFMRDEHESGLQQPELNPDGTPKPKDESAPEPPLNKLIKVALARRMERMKGPRFGVNTKKHAHSHLNGKGHA